MSGKPGLTATLEKKEHRPAEMESYRIPQAGLEETASASQAAGVQVHTTTCSSAATWSPEPGQPGSVTHICSQSVGRHLLHPSAPPGPALLQQLPE